MKEANVSGTIHATSLYIGSGNNEKDVFNYVGDYIDDDLDTYSENLFGSNNLTNADTSGGHYTPNLITILKRDTTQDSDGNTIKFLYGGRSIGTKGTISDAASSGTATYAYFEVDQNGLLTARNAVITGTVYASAGYIGNWDIGYKGFGILRSSNEKMILDPTGQTYFSIPGINNDNYTGTNAMLIITSDEGDGITNASGNATDGYTQSVSNNSNRKGVVITADGGLYANKGYFSGTLNAASGLIGGWTINKNSISATNGSTTIVLSSRGRIALTNTQTVEDASGNEQFTTTSGFDLNVSTGTLTLTNVDLKMVAVKSGTIGKNTLLEGSDYEYDAEGNLVEDEDGNPVPLNTSATINTIATNGTKAVKKDDPLSTSNADATTKYAFRVTSGGKLTCTGATIVGGSSASGNLIEGINATDGTVSFSVTQAGQLTCTGATITGSGSGNLIEGINATNGTVSFSVTQDGKLTCTGADISGKMTAGSIEADVDIKTPTISSGLYLPYRSSSSSSRYTGLILNLTGSGHYGGWRDSLFTVGGNYDTGKPFYAFIRGAGSESNQRTNAFLGVQNQSGTYNIEADSTGPGYDPDNSTANYVAYIRFDGTAYFSTLTIGDNINVGTELADLKRRVKDLEDNQ